MPPTPDARTNKQRRCFREAYFVIAFLCAMGTVLGLLLTYRTRDTREDRDASIIAT